MSVEILEKENCKVPILGVINMKAKISIKINGYYK